MQGGCSSNGYDGGGSRDAVVDVCCSNGYDGGDTLAAVENVCSSNGCDGRCALDAVVDACSFVGSDCGDALGDVESGCSSISELMVAVLLKISEANAALMDMAAKSLPIKQRMITTSLYRETL